MTHSVVDAQPQLTIGIDARAAAEVGAGRGRVVRELLRAFAAREAPHRYRCYARQRWEEPLDERFQWDLLDARDPVWQLRTAAMASRACDVFLSTNSYLMVALLRVPAVAIVYDLVTFEPELRPPRSALIERVTLRLAVRSGQPLVCISEATAGALLKHFPKAGGQITVAPLGVSPSLSAPSATELAELPPAGFVLSVGTLEPRKNLPRLVAAYASLPLALQEAHPLVVVGARGWDTGPTLAALRSLGDRCVVLGRVSDGALAELYHRCAAFCYPSLGEGFGLPVLEAMAAGAAVVTSNVSSMPEVGGDAVEYVDPRAVASIATGLERLLSSPARRTQLGALAFERAQQFSWDTCAERTLAALEHAARTD